MLKLWRGLYARFDLHKADRVLVLIVKLLFWWVYVEGYIDSTTRRRNFEAFFGLEEKGEENE